MQLGKILFLGGAPFQVPIIKKANEMGFTTICVDNRKNNPGHKIAKKSYIESTINKLEILEIAKNEQINGIVSYGSDVALKTQAFVCKNMGLFGPTIESVNILTNKHQFKLFLSELGIQKQFNIKFNSSNFLNAKKKAEEFLRQFNSDIFVKPIDSSGGKGVTKVSDISLLKNAMNLAVENSLTRKGLIEESFDQIEDQICGDGFILNSKVLFIGLGIGKFTGEVYSPYAEIFPLKLGEKAFLNITKKIETVLVQAGYKNGPFNLDVLRLKGGEIKFLELAPRCGGNFLSDAIKVSYGIDLQKALILFSRFGPSGLKANFFKAKKQKNVYNLMVMPITSGLYTGLKLPENSMKLMKKNIWINQGDQVSKFNNGGQYLGNLLFSAKNVMDIQKFDQQIVESEYVLIKEK